MAEFISNTITTMVKWLTLMVNNSWLASGVKHGEIPALNGSIPGGFFVAGSIMGRQLGHFPSIHGADSREKFWDILQKPWSLGLGLSHLEGH